MLHFTLSLQINLGIYFQDDKKEFSVLVDRALGGSSLVDGQIELMLHRYVITFPMLIYLMVHEQIS
jgi:hypothetical protein